jgi:hypothetical protein
MCSIVDILNEDLKENLFGVGASIEEFSHALIIGQLFLFF